MKDNAHHQIITTNKVINNIFLSLMCLLHSDNSSFILQKKMLSCLHFWNIMIDWLDILPIYKSCTDPSVTFSCSLEYSGLQFA